MARRPKLPAPLPDPTKVAETRQWLAVANFYLRHGRQVPGHVRRALVLRSAFWKGLEIPQCVAEAKQLLARSGKQ